jgi:hypothetical protein
VYFGLVDRVLKESSKLNGSRIQGGSWSAMHTPGGRFLN